MALEHERQLLTPWITPTNPKLKFVGQFKGCPEFSGRSGRYVM